MVSWLQLLVWCTWALGICHFIRRCKDELQAVWLLRCIMQQIQKCLVLLHTYKRSFHQQFKDDEFVFYTLHCGQDNNFSNLDIVSSFKVQIIRDPRAEDCLLGPVNNVHKASAEYLTVVTQNNLGPEFTNSQSGIRHDDTQPVSTESKFFFYDSLSGPVVSSSDEKYFNFGYL
ncbi:hypothetical protein F5051DRAFT_432768 [Lentinula edodes]|nr:hypothetical protein F5051DRAFT_432768 [Lentinula edodes]